VADAMSINAAINVERRSMGNSSGGEGDLTLSEVIKFAGGWRVRFAQPTAVSADDRRPRCRKSIF
jgi:hypothetical protein